MGGGSSKHSKVIKVLSSGDSKIISMPFAHSKDHVTVLLNNLVAFQKSSDFCDLKLQIRDSNKNVSKSYQVHKCILAACSGYCREILQSNTKGDTGDGSKDSGSETTDAGSLASGGDVTTIDIDFPISEAMMDLIIGYIYSADLDVKAKDLPDLLEIATRLKIMSLKKHCVWAMRNGYMLEFLHPVLEMSEVLDLPEVREFALRRTIEKFDEFLDSKSFLQLSEKEIQVLVDNRRGWAVDGIIIPEVEMFNAILKWEKHNHSQREGAARLLLRHLHYHKIPRTTLSGYVVTHDLVCGDKELMGSIEEAIGSDKKKILKRLKRKIAQNRSAEEDSIASNACSGDGSTGGSQPTVVVCGGRLFDQMTAQVLQLNERENNWRELSRIPTVLSNHAAVVVENALYVAGGENSTISGCHSIANAWRYEPPPRNEWISMPDMQHSRSSFYVGAFNDYLLAFGGKSSKITRNSVEKYNIASKKWEFAASLKTPRYAHAGCAHKNMLYVSGGIVGKHSSVDMLRMDVTANHWTAMSPMKCARSRHSMVRVRDRIYVIGGDDDSLGVTRSSSIAIECYTPEYDQWHSVALKIPVQSDREFGCVELDGHIYVVGGCKSQLAEHRAEVSTYDPEEDRWEVKAKLPRRLRGAACVVLNLDT